MTHFAHINHETFGPWAIVTGASSGLGEEFARQLAANGLNVVLVARREALLESLGRALQNQYGIDYRVVALDLTTPDFMTTLEEATHDLDIGLVISNAGTGTPGAFLALDKSELQEMVHLNVFPHLALTHHYGRRMAKRGYGGFLLVSAMGAADGLPYMANDAATKAYIISLGKGLHTEFKKLGLTMTVVIPGPTETPIIDKFGFTAAQMPVKPMSVQQGVAEGLAALQANRTSHITGRLNRIMQAVVPAGISRRILGNMIAKGAASKRPFLQAQH